jgi:porphobilinogen deaminase
MITRLNHHEALLCWRAEREFLRRLEGDCGTPVGVLAQIENGFMRLRAQVFAEVEPESKVGEVRMQIAEEEPEAIAASLFQLMYGSKK